MPVSLTIRDMREEVRDELAARAARAGQSLEEYVRGHLNAMVVTSNPVEFWDRVRDRLRATESQVPTEGDPWGPGSRPPVVSPHGGGVMNPEPERSRRWWVDGERVVADVVEGLSDDDLAGPSRLPGWTRAHVVAHLARNADALGNLLTWARTGVETPMYPSPEARDRDIASTAAMPADELRADFTAACRRFADDIENLPAEAWTATVRTRQGRPIEATEVPWMRAKEIWVHGTDLDAGLGFGELPTDYASALVDDVLGHFAGRGEALEVSVAATDIDRQWGSGEPTVHGPVSAIAAWLTRGDSSGLPGDVPAPPVWL